jgi:outer membrane protein assembly factor BamB
MQTRAGATLVCLVAAGALLAASVLGAQQAGWSQFGGPSRNFHVVATGLADSWPEGGPKQLWKRPLGDGFSAIAADGNVLFTMYQKGELETVIALDAQTGATMWETPYRSPITTNETRAPGPRATPLVVGDALFTVGSTGKLHRLNKASGKIEWAHDVYAEFKPPLQDEYYAASPLAYRSTIIVPVGAPGASVVAFDQKAGKVVWQAHDFKASYASPILIDVDGQQQAVLMMETEVIGIDPSNGALLWSHPHANRTKTNVSTPVWGEGNLLFVSSAYDSGGRMLRLARKGSATSVEEVWFSRDLRVHVANPIRIGDTIYGSSGDFGPAFFSALDARTGKVKWQQRDVVKSSLLYADGKFVMLNENGELWLASPGAEGLQVHGKAQILKAISYTPPSLVGTRIYLRDRENVMALDLARR